MENNKKISSSSSSSMSYLRYVPIGTLNHYATLSGCAWLCFMVFSGRWNTPFKYFLYWYCLDEFDSIWIIIYFRSQIFNFAFNVITTFHSFPINHFWSKCVYTLFRPLWKMYFYSFIRIHEKIKIFHYLYIQQEMRKCYNKRHSVHKFEKC